MTIAFRMYTISYKLGAHSNVVEIDLSTLKLFSYRISKKGARKFVFFLFLCPPHLFLPPSACHFIVLEKWIGY